MRKAGATERSGGDSRAWTQGERVWHTLREWIQSGRRAPGRPLRLRALAQEMETSIIPVRDALVRLEQEGLVEGAANRGWRVCHYDPQRLDDLAILREATECQVARLCAERATDEELEELALLARQADRARGEALSNACEQRFHLRLAAVAGSGILLDAIRKANVLQLTFGPSRMRTWRGRVHERLVRAIRTRDADLAEREMRRHLPQRGKEKPGDNKGKSTLRGAAARRRKRRNRS